MIPINEDVNFAVFLHDLNQNYWKTYILLIAFFVSVKIFLSTSIVAKESINFNVFNYVDIIFITIVLRF